MSRHLNSQRDLSHTELGGCLLSRCTSASNSVSTRTRQRDNDCLRVSAAMALTVCPIKARSALARPTPRSSLGLKNFCKPRRYQTDSTGVVIEPLSACLRISRRH